MTISSDPAAVVTPLRAEPGEAGNVPSRDPEQPAPAPTPTAVPTLRSLFGLHRRRMLVTYALFNVENVLRLAQPLVLGLAINGLLVQSYAGLWLLVAQHLSHMLISSFRRMYDTRVFTEIYSELAGRLIADQRGQRIDVSRVAARSARRARIPVRSGRAVGERSGRSRCEQLRLSRGTGSALPAGSS